MLYLSNSFVWFWTPRPCHRETKNADPSLQNVVFHNGAECFRPLHLPHKNTIDAHPSTLKLAFSMTALNAFEAKSYPSVPEIVDDLDSNPTITIISADDVINATEAASLTISGKGDAGNVIELFFSSGTIFV